MAWAFRIARVAGIDIKVHVTFFLILIWGAAQWPQFGVTGYLFGAGVMLLLFLCVTLHELGHSVVAQRFGITVRQIILLSSNIGLVLFNMIPAFPLDGGRVLRSLLAMRMPWQRATNTAATIGRVMAMLLGLFGLLTGSWSMVFVALFVFLAAGAEAVEGQARTVLASQRVGDAYNQNAIVLSTHDRLSTVVHYILTSYQPDFAVMDGRQVVGLVTRADVIRALASGAGDVPVTQVMQPHPLRVEAGQTLDAVHRQLNEQQSRVAAVYDGPRYMGLVSAEDIAEAYAVLRFLDGNGQAAAAPKEGGVVV